MIIGESPGIMEVVGKKPFVGPSGEVIHKTLERAGIDSLNIEPYFTNAIHCLPRLKDPVNVREACQRCQSRLYAEITAYPRKVILALGGPSLQSLLNNFDLKITKERGKLFRTNFASIGIVAAVHPAFLLRGAGNYTQFERDVKYAVDLMKHGEKARRLPSGTTYEVLDNKSLVRDFISLLEKKPQDSDIAADIETTGFNYQTDRILCTGFQYEPDKSVIVTEGLLEDGLFQEHLNYTWHNGKFDCRFLRFNGFGGARVDDDTLLLSYALNERRGIHDLDQAASDWLGSVNHKDMVSEFYKGFVIDEATGQKRRRNLSDAPKDLLYEYLARDINDTYHLKEKLYPQVMEDKNLKKFYLNHLWPGSEYLLKLEMNGMLVDRDQVLKNFHRLHDELTQIEQQLNNVAIRAMGKEINPRSWQQVKALLYGALKLGPMSLSTNEDTLLTLPKHEAVTLLLKHREAAKAKGTYVHPLMYGDDRKLIVDAKGKQTKKESMLYPDGRTHSSYLLHGTPTSRLACRDLNVQNIPRDPLLRGQFIARPGYILLECDYSQAELRSLAALSKCEALMAIFLNDLDLHVEFSTYLFGSNFTHEEKMAAKTVNFGIPYGREAPSIAADPQLNTKMDITIQKAQSWIDGWGTRFPGAWKFIQECAMAPVRNQTIVTCFGNKKRPGVVSREKLRDLQNESRNFPHQSIASNLTIRAGIELFDLLRDEYDTHIINTVHDCIVMETPINLPHIFEVARVVQKKMEEIPTRFPALRIVPFKASAEVGHRWGNLVKLKTLKDQSTCYLHSMPRDIAAH